MTTYRIDDLARAADTTVRYIRALQERGVLPPPRREGRVGKYDDSHLARIRLIGQLQDRGYTMATIAELISAWEHGHDLGDLLGLEKALTDPWSDETPGRISLTELGDLFFPGEARKELAAMTAEQIADILARAEALGFIEPAGDHYRVPSPRLLHVGAELVAAGIPLTTVFDVADEVSDDCDVIARRFVQMAADHGNLDDSSHNAVRQDLPEVADLIQRLRPLSYLAVKGLLARSLQVQIQAKTSDQIERIARTSPHRPTPG